MFIPRTRSSLHFQVDTVRSCLTHTKTFSLKYGNTIKNSYCNVIAFRIWCTSTILKRKAKKKALILSLIFVVRMYVSVCVCVSFIHLLSLSLCVCMYFVVLHKLPLPLPSTSMPYYFTCSSFLKSAYCRTAHNPMAQNSFQQLPERWLSKHNFSPTMWHG